MTRSEKMTNNKNAVKHGVRAFQARGEQALTSTGRSRHSELRELVQSREGIVELLQQRAADAVMVVEMAISYVAKQTQDGHPLADIPVMRALPAYQNSAVRALHTLADMMPKDKDIDINTFEVTDEDKSTDHD